MPISPGRAIVILVLALGFGLPSLAHAQTETCAEASGCTEDAQSAAAFVDSVGVNTHLGYDDQPYGKAWPMIYDRLVELGVKHIRDRTYRDGTRLADVAPRMRQLQTRGIRGNLLSGDPLGRYDSGTIEQHLAWVRKNVPGFVESLEGPNEYDRPYDDPNWQSTLRAYQCEWAQKVRADPVLAGKRVIGPSPGGVGFDSLGDLSACLDAGNLHPYPGQWSPDTSNAGDLSVHLAAARKVSGPRPIWITESGYHNALRCTCGHDPVSEAAAGVYVPRMFMEYFRRGIARTYAYELIDGQPDPERTDPERNFGLLRNDGTRKPAFTTTRNLLTILRDDGTASGRLSFNLRCEAGCTAPLRHLLLRKTTGDYYLAVWPESSVWDGSSRSDRINKSQRVQLSLPAPHTLEVFDPARSSDAISKTTASSRRLTLSDGMLLVKISPAALARTGAKDASARASASTDDDAVRAALAWTADSAARRLRPPGASQLRRRGSLRLAARWARAGRYTLRLARGGNVARGGRSFGNAGTKPLLLRRDRRGGRLLRLGSRRRMTLYVTFAARAGTRLTVRRHVTATR